MVLLDPSPIPNLHLITVQVQEREPQTIVTLPYIWCAKPGMVYTDDTRVASSNITHHHRLLAWEISGGKLGTLASYRHARAILPNFETLDPQVVGQWAACDTLPQALQHNLVMTALLKQMRIHRLTNRKMWKLIINPLCKVWGAGSI